MNFNRFDLNLLLIFDAISREGNLTRAGQRLGLSQPAVSAALARLRDMIGDPLFIRSSGGVTPTGKAMEIAGPIGAALSSIRDVLQTQQLFDPLTSQRCFKLLMPDIGALNMLPRLLEYLRGIGSKISIATAQVERGGELEQLEKGMQDLAVGVWPELTPSRGVFRQPLFTDSFVCVARGDHAGIGSSVSLEQLLEASHIIVSKNETSQGPLNRILASGNSRLKVAVRLPHYLAVPAILECSDLVVVMPARPASMFAASYGLRSVPLAFDLAPLEVCQYWHHRFNNDSGLSWLVSVMHKLFGKPSSAGADTVIRPSARLLPQ